MKKQIISGGVFIILLLGFSGCFGNESDDETNKFIGTWNQGNTDSGHALSDFGSFVFTSKYTFKSKENGTYEINNDSISLNFGDEEKVWNFKYSFSENNNKLNLIDSEGKSSIFTKN